MSTLILLVALLGNVMCGFFAELYPFFHWTSRRLQQSDQELKMLCNISSDIPGAQVVFNENLLQRLCTDQQLISVSGVCEDVPPIWQELQTELPCSVVVSEGLCNDNFVTRANYCAKSCDRCKEQACTKTLAGCACSSPWEFRETGAQYPGCANPDGDPKGPWCEIDRSTCEREPATKTYDYCSTDCVEAEVKKEENAIVGNGLDEVPFPHVPIPPSCLNHNSKCAKKCGGEHKIEEIYCDIEGERCECIEEESCDDLQLKCEDNCKQNGEIIRQFDCQIDKSQQTICVCEPPSAVISASPSLRRLPPTPSTLPSPLTLAPSPTSLFQDTLVVGQCFNYLPPQEASCAERLEWGSCNEWWMKEKYYCAATCGFCGSGGSEQCFQGFQECASECGGDMKIQFFACYQNYGGKTDCVCRSSQRSFQPAISLPDGGVCEDVSPPGGNSCEQRVSWGSCSEWWFRKGDYCAKSCGYCRDSNDPELKDKKPQHTSQNSNKDTKNILVAPPASSTIFLDPAGITAARSIKYETLQDSDSALFQSLGMIPIFIERSFYQTVENITLAVSDEPEALEVPKLDNVLQERKGLTKKDFLDAHNTIRQQYCVKDLKWSGELTQESEVWASKCVMELDVTTPYGQNMFMDTSLKNTSASSATQNWIRNVQEYNFKRPVVGLKFSTLTQLLWSETSKVGCGTAQCPRGQLIVCRYDPTGNVPGSTSENIFHPSECS